MGVTKQGKIAILTNYREKQPENAGELQSRGAIVNSWLTTSPTDSQSCKQKTEHFVADLVASNLSRRTGGFSLACGRANEPLAIVSNRSAKLDQVKWVATEKGQTIGLSNTAVDDRTWPKILHGEELTKAAIESHVQAQVDDHDENEDRLIARLLRVLSIDTLPRVRSTVSSDQDNGTKESESYVTDLKESIFIPLIGVREDYGQLETQKHNVNADNNNVKAPGPNDNGDDDYEVTVSRNVANSTESPPVDHRDNNNVNYSTGAYGTQKQTIILVSESGRIRYFERTLYDSNANAIPIGQGDRSFEFFVDDSDA